MWGLNWQPCGQDLTWHQESDMSLTKPPRPWSLQILCVKMLDWGQKTLSPPPPPEQSGEFEGQNQTASHIKSGSLLLSCTATFNELCPWSPRGVSSETEASILLLGCHLILQLTCFDKQVSHGVPLPHILSRPFGRAKKMCFFYAAWHT